MFWIPTDDGSIEGIVKALLVELDDVGFSISDLGVFTEVGETGDKSDANDDDNKDGNEDDDNDDEIDGSDEAVELKFQGELALSGRIQANNIIKMNNKYKINNQILLLENGFIKLVMDKFWPIKHK